MKLLLVHMRYHPDATGTAPLVTQLAQDLVQDGIEVEVITSLPHYGRTDIHPDYQHRQGFFHQSTENGVAIIRTPVYIPRSPRLIQRAFNYLSYNLNSIFAGFIVRDVDLVLAVNPPITTSFSAWVMSIIHRAPLIISIQDVWPDCVIQVGQLQNRFLIVISRFFERFQYTIAKKIVVLSEGMKNNLKRKGIPEHKIEIIANWADLDEVIPVEKRNTFYTKHHLKGKFVLLFSGNLGYNAALESIIEAAYLLQDEKDILFIIAGAGNVKTDLIELVRSKELNNVKFLPTLPKDEWLEMISAADLGLVTLRKDLADLNVPSKVYTLMSAGCPILASVPEQSEVYKIVNAANCGYGSAPEDPSKLAERILECKIDKNKLKQLGSNGRNYLMIHLNRKGQTARYINLIKEWINKEEQL